MVDFFASRRCMEDFFINPIIVDDAPSNTFRTTHTTNMDGATQYKAALHDYHHERRSSSSKDAAALKQFALPITSSMLTRQSDYWQGYTSEEEQPSPVDNDNSSSTSGEAISAGSDVFCPEHLAIACVAVEQQCSKARAVKIQSAGKARIVSLPKLVTTTSASRGVIHVADRGDNEGRRSSVLHLDPILESRSVRTSQDSNSSRNSSNGSTSPTSPASTAPSSVDESMEKPHVPLRHAKTVSRHVPLMEAARALTPTTPVFPQSATSLRRGSLPDPRSPVNQQQQQQTKRTSKFGGLNRALTIGRNPTTTRKENGSDLESIKYSETTSGTAPWIQGDGRPSAVKKLVARGADERAPTIILPPFPLR